MHKEHSSCWWWRCLIVAHSTHWTTVEAAAEATATATVATSTSTTSAASTTASTSSHHCHLLQRRRNLLLRLRQNRRELTCALRICVREECDGHALRSGTTGTANAVHIVFTIIREVVIDHELDVFHICRREDDKNFTHAHAHTHTHTENHHYRGEMSAHINTKNHQKWRIPKTIRSHNYLCHAYSPSHMHEQSCAHAEACFHTLASPPPPSTTRFTF